MCPFGKPPNTPAGRSENPESNLLEGTNIEPRRRPILGSGRMGGESGLLNPELNPPEAGLLVPTIDSSNIPIGSNLPSTGHVSPGTNAREGQAGGSEGSFGVRPVEPITVTTQSSDIRFTEASPSLRRRSPFPSFPYPSPPEARGIETMRMDQGALTVPPVMSLGDRNIGGMMKNIIQIH